MLPTEGDKVLVLDANAPTIGKVALSRASTALLRGVFCAAALCDGCVVEAAHCEPELCCACQCCSAHTLGGFGEHGGPELDSDALVAALLRAPLDVLTSTAAWLRGYTRASERSPGSSVAAAQPLLFAIRAATVVLAFATSVCEAEEIGIADVERALTEAATWIRRVWLEQAQDFPDFFDDAQTLEVQISAHLVLRRGLGSGEVPPSRPALGVAVRCFEDADERCTAFDVVLNDGRSVRGLCEHRVRSRGEDVAARASTSPQRRSTASRRFGAAPRRAGERVGARVFVRAAFLRFQDGFAASSSASASSGGGTSSGASPARGGAKNAGAMRLATLKLLAAQGVTSLPQLRVMLADRSRRDPRYWEQLLLMYGDVGGR